MAFWAFGGGGGGGPHEHDSAYVNETDHTTAVHDALNIDAETLDGIDSAAFLLGLDHTKAVHDALDIVPAAHGPAKHTGTSDEPALLMGLSGAIPAAQADAADFLVVVPFDMTLRRIKATAKTAPADAMSIQIRRSVDAGASFADAFGAVAFVAAAKVATADPADLDVNEGDVMNISIATGSGSNLLVELIGKAR